MTYNLTINPTTDGQTPKYTSKHPDGHRAVISSVTGNVANGETLTINGHFSAKRNGDLFSLISRITDSGESVISTYNHTQDESFLGTGSSIMRVMHAPVGTIEDPRIDVGLHDELYCSYLYKINVSNYGINAQGPQLKMQRMMVPPNDDSNGASSTSIYFYGEGATSNGVGLRPGVNGLGDGSVDPDEYTNQGLTALDTINTWVRKWEYIKKNDAGLPNGATFVCFKVEGTKDCLFNLRAGGVHMSDPRVPADTLLTPFFTPKYFHQTSGIAVDGSSVILPYYIRGGLEMEIFIDGYIMNDSPESVWLVDSTDVDASMATGKAVHLPSSARSETQITATCWLGDFTTSDNVYLTTFNQDGKYANPVLVRSAV